MVLSKTMPIKECAGGIIINDKGEICVIRNKRPGFPKGGKKPQESPIENAIREIKEETSITQLELIKELGTYQRYSKSGKQIKKITLFLFKTLQDFNSISLDAIQDTKIKEIRGCTLDELYSLFTAEANPKDLEFLKEKENDIIEHLVLCNQEYEMCQK